MYYQELTSHALGGLAGSLRTARYSSERQADVKLRHACHLERMTSYQKSDSFNRCISTWRITWQIPSRSDLKRRSPVFFFEERCLNKKNNNKIIGDMGSVPAQKSWFKRRKSSFQNLNQVFNLQCVGWNRLSSRQCSAVWTKKPCCRREAAWCRSNVALDIT